MSSILDPDLIREAAAEKGIDPAFIEKDWYAVQLLKSLDAFKNDRGVELIFSGGTSLSKGFGLIKRFSEDLDFILCSTKNVSVGGRRAFRKSVISHITSDARFSIEEDAVKRGDSHRFFKAPVCYNMAFEQSFLRPHLQLEMTFSQHRLPLLKQNVQSMISELSGGEPETQITCISPIETASDKISALTWRVVVRGESSEYDPTMIRHLYDLAWLKNTILEDKEAFIHCAQQSLQQDQERRGGDIIATMSISDRMQKAFDLLSKDEAYREEYQTFAQNMSYSDETEKIPFDGALLTLKEIIDMVSTGNNVCTEK
ncbi:MAG: nucleotidyl transferase AbiEii/AbiGii toxin family protein [Bdellovibrionota bacterium]